MRFSSDISVWWLLPWIGISITAAYWFYRNNAWANELSSRLRNSFITLRAAILFILGLLLIGLIFEAVGYRNEKPLIFLVTDNSTSMKNYRDSSTIRNKITDLKRQVTAELGEDYEFISLSAGSFPEYHDSVLFNEHTTDLSSVFDQVRTDYYNRNIGGIVLISDGNFNKGSNPVYSAEKIDLTPVFTIGTGDTIKKRDQYIKHVGVNDVTFFKSKFPVEIDIEAVKIGKGPVTVTISRNKKVVASQTVNYSNGKYDFEHASFLLEADQVGFQTYTVSITRANNEYNYANNSRTFYVEVLDDRSKITILAGAPHPDVAAIKQVLEQDENMEVESVLLKDWDKELKKTDLIIWHEPGIGYDGNILDLIERSKVPVLFIAGPNTSSAVIQKLNAGWSVNGGSQTDDVQGTINEGFKQFEVSEELKKAMAFYPPLKVKFGDMRVSGGAEVLVYQRLGTIKKKEPLIFFGKKGNVRIGTICGEGIWQWRVNEYVRTGEQKGFQELIGKTTQYLLVKQNASNLRVNFPKRFTRDEDVIVNASFYNESLEPVGTARIRLEVTDTRKKISRYEFASAGDLYKAVLGKMKPGTYEWKATATYNGKTYKKNGSFVVEDVHIEDLNTDADHRILKQIADATHGKFYEMERSGSLIDDIRKRDDITSVSFRESAFVDLIDLKWMLALLLLLLSLEWFLRRWYGSY